MNKKIIISILVSFFVMIFYSCEKKAGPVLKISESAAITYPASGETYVLSEADADNVFAVFKWTEAEYNVPISISYSLEVDLKSDNFADPVVLGTTDADSLEITVFDFNKILTNTLGLQEGQAAEISVRVGSYGAESEKSYSTAIDLTVTPYAPPNAPDSLFVISGGNVIAKILPKDEDGNYEGYAWLPASDLTFIISEDRNGDVYYGDNEPDDVLDSDGSSIVVPAEGHYKINVNTFDLSYTASPEAWGIIGSAVDPYDWSVDINMTYLVSEGVWQISTDTLANPIVDGEFKFRPNDSWDPLNYGDDGADGIPDEYGANIAISAGNYKITLDLREYPYSYSVTPIVK